MSGKSEKYLYKENICGINERENGSTVEEQRFGSI